MFICTDMEVFEFIYKKITTVPIKFNVMGKLFCVSKETLMSMENTFFYGLVANMDKFKPLEDGTFFIERDPLVFGRILNYLRTGKMDTSDLSPYAVDMLKDDLDYYLIPRPVELKDIEKIYITHPEITE